MKKIPFAKVVDSKFSKHNPFPGSGFRNGSIKKFPKIKEELK